MRVLSFNDVSPVAPAECPAPAVAWRQGWARPAFRHSWLLLLGLMFGVLVPVVPHFFLVIQARPGPVLADPLLTLLPRQDVATAVFVLMYGSVVVGVGWLTRQPDLFLRGMWALLLLLLLRMATIWLLPLVPPLDMLPMPDPFTARVFHTAAGTAITKDLFFSASATRALYLRCAGRPFICLAGLLGRGAHCPARRGTARGYHPTTGGGGLKAEQPEATTRQLVEAG